MPISVEMPRLSDTMEEGTLVKWRVKVGDTINSGDHLADVETDKATMELQAFDDGTVTHINIDEGQTVPVGQPILILDGEGETPETGSPEVETPTKPSPSTLNPQPSTPKSSVKVSPVARRMAEQQGIDLSTIQGTGPDGRIIKRDLTPGSSPPRDPSPPKAQGLPSPGSPSNPPTPIKLSSMRKTIARRLVESKTTIPHFTVAMSINMDPLIDLRQTINSQLESQGGGIKLSVGDFITRAVALACVEHPLVNSAWDGEQILQHPAVNVGIAVALSQEQGGGLVVPVLRDAANMTLRQISTATKALAQKARDSGLTLDEMTGGTITISNLGMFGVNQFTAIINPPEAAILAIGAAIEKPVVRDGNLTIGREMTVTLCADHRVLDGAIVSQYLTTFKNLLENPAAMLV